MGGLRSDQAGGLHGPGHGAQDGVRLAQITLDIGRQLQPKICALERLQFVGGIGAVRVCLVEIHGAGSDWIRGSPPR